MAVNRDDIYDAIRNADKAGDTESVQKLGAYLATLDKAPSEPAVSPFKYTPITSPQGGYLRGAPMGPRVDTTPENYKKAAQAGVDITTGAPGLTLGSLADEAHRDAYIKSLLVSKKIISDPATQTRKGPESGLLEYKPDKGSRWVTAESVGSNGNPLHHLRGALTNAGSLALGAGGTLLGALGGPEGATALGATGGVVGAAGGTTAANYLAKKAGVIPDSESVTQGSGESAKDAAIGEAVSLGGYGVYKGIKSWATGLKVFKPEQAAELINKQKIAQSTIEQIEKTTGMPFKPTAAEVAARPRYDDQGNLLPPTATDIAAAKKQLTAAGQNTEVNSQFQLRNQQNQATLRNYFTKALEAPPQTPDKATAGSQVISGVTDLYDKSLGAAKDLIGKLPPGTDDEQAAKILHESLVTARDTYKQQLVDPKYAAVKQAIGFNPETFSSNIHVPWSAGARALDKQLSARDIQLAREFGENPLADQTTTVGAKAPTETPPFNEWNMSTTENPTVDLAILNERIKDVGNLKRLKGSGDERIKVDEKRLGDIQSSLMTMRDQYLEKNYPDVLKLQQGADTEFKSWLGKYDRAITRQMLIKGPDGKFRFTEGETLQKLFQSGDYGALKQFANNVAAYPEAKSQVNHMLLALYRQDYTSDGIPSLESHAKFLKDYKPILSAFFGPEGLPEVSKIGGLAKTVAEEDQIVKNLGIGAKYFAGDELNSLTPENIVNQVVSGTIKPARMRAIVAQLNTYPYKEQAIENWKSSVADGVTKKIVGDDGYVDPAKLSAFMKGDGKDSLVELFSAAKDAGGYKVADMLKTLQEGAQLVNQANLLAQVDPNKSIIRSGVRAAIGPLSREGNLITLGKNMREKFTAQRVYQAMTDPAELKRLADSLGPQITRIRQLIAAGSLGGNRIKDDY